MSVATKSPMLEWAEYNLDRGLSVFLVQPRLKLPAEQHGFKDASAMPAAIEAKWGHIPDANIGVACGESNLAVLDFDNGADLPDYIKNLNTYQVKTARGVHVYLWGARPTARYGARVCRVPARCPEG